MSSLADVLDSSKDDLFKSLGVIKDDDERELTAEELDELYKTIPYGERIRDLRLIDNEFFTAVFNNNIEATQEMLDVIMGEGQVVVQSVTAQAEKSILEGHSLTLDVDAIDKNGVHYDIEIQRASKGAPPERARYHSSVMDIGALVKNTNDFIELKKAYVIFYTEHDVLKGGLPIYHINRTIEELGNRQFNDGSCIIYVNGAYKGEDKFGALADDFKAKDPKEMHSKILAKSVKECKETKKGARHMSEVVEEIVKEETEKIKRERDKEIIKRTYNAGVSTEKIANIYNISVQEVKTLLDED